MTRSILTPKMEQALADLRAKGCRVVGPDPITPGNTPPTPDTQVPLPGMHVHVVRGSALIEGFGGTADEAVSDALGKLARLE